jgi:hypothetical protein
MVDLTIALVGIGFIYFGWGLAQRLHRLLSSGEESWLLWCAAKRCLTLVDTEKAGQTTGPDRTVTHCLLWSEQDHECDQQCVRAPGKAAGCLLEHPPQAPAKQKCRQRRP